MISGVHPFFQAGTDEGTLLQSIAEGDSERLQDLVSGLPRGTAEAVHKAFSPRAGDRYIFCYEFIAAAFPLSEMAVVGTTTTAVPVPAAGVEEPVQVNPERDARLDDPEQFLVSVLLENESAPSAAEASTPAVEASTAVAGWCATGAFPAAAGTQLAREAPQPPPSPGATQSLPAFAGEPATVLFPTKPADSSSAPAPVSAPPGAITGEFTTVFAVPKAGGDEIAPTGSPLPDVALTVTSCSDPAALGRETIVGHFPFRIGRSEGDLLLPFDPAVSNVHAEIDFRDGGFTIRDLGSSNGTFIGGKRLQPDRAEPLLFGARISVGSDTQLMFGSNELSEIPDLTGTIINSKYVLAQKLHGSAKSVVYAATDRFLPRTVTVKLLSPKLPRPTRTRERCWAVQCFPPNSRATRDTASSSSATPRPPPA
jgi:pSer/pThr/pTyr-binding forkhead associated (FHA) protein